MADASGQLKAEKRRLNPEPVMVQPQLADSFIFVPNCHNVFSLDLLILIENRGNRVWVFKTARALQCRKKIIDLPCQTARLPLLSNFLTLFLAPNNGCIGKHVPWIGTKGLLFWLSRPCICCLRARRGPPQLAASIMQATEVCRLLAP